MAPLHVIFAPLVCPLNFLGRSDDNNTPVIVALARKIMMVVGLGGQEWWGWSSPYAVPGMHNKWPQNRGFPGGSSLKTLCPPIALQKLECLLGQPKDRSGHCLHRIERNSWLWPGYRAL